MYFYRRMIIARFVLVALLLVSASAGAVQPDEVLADPAMEARARAISAELRCLVCQNQSIDDSDADLAHDVRVLVRQRLQAGDSDAAVKNYLVERYGDYVLLNPPIKDTTILLWAGMPIFLIGGGLAAWTLYRRRSSSAMVPPPLSPEETQRLAALLRADHNQE